MQKTKDYSELDLTNSFIFSKVMTDERLCKRLLDICVDDPSIELGDDETKIFLNPYGSGEISEELSEFFGYLREHKPTGEFTKALDESVTTARGSAVWRKEYMTLEMEIRHAAHVAREEGDTGRLVNLICKKLKKGMPVAQIAEAVEEDEARVQAIVDVANKYAPDYDVEKIVREILA